jgi:hypothetical protein
MWVFIATGFTGALTLAFLFRRPSRLAGRAVQRQRAGSKHLFASVVKKQKPKTSSRILLDILSEGAKDNSIEAVSLPTTVCTSALFAIAPPSRAGVVAPMAT